MYLLGALFWALLSASVAYGIGRLLTRKLEGWWWRWLIGAALLPIIFMAPLADQLVGKYQFDQLCEAAEKEARIYGTIPVGEELYTSEGKWRLGLTSSWDERTALSKTADSLLRRETKTTDLQMAILIQQYDEKIFDRNTDRLLAEWRTLVMVGRGFSHSFVPSFVMGRTCTPKLINPIVDIQLLPFAKGTNK